MISALADTGAQSNLWGWKDFQDSGFDNNDSCMKSILICCAHKT